MDRYCSCLSFEFWISEWCHQTTKTDLFVLFSLEVNPKSARVDYFTLVSKSFIQNESTERCFTLHPSWTFTPHSDPNRSHPLVCICFAESINLEMVCDESQRRQLQPYCAAYHSASLRSPHHWRDHYHIDGLWLLTLICPRCLWIVTTCSWTGRRHGAPWTQGWSSATSIWVRRWSWPSGCPNSPCRWNCPTTISASSKAGGFPSCPTEGEASVNLLLLWPIWSRREITVS